MTNRNPTTLNLCAQRKDSTGVANSCWISSGPPITTTRIGPEPRRQMGPCVVLISSSAMGGSLNNLRTRRTLSRFPGRGMGLTAMSDSIGICSAFQFQAGTNPACVGGPSVACSNHRHHDFDDDNRTEADASDSGDTSNGPSVGWATHRRARRPDDHPIETKQTNESGQ